MRADFVAVCNGRQSRLADWLHELGYSKPTTREVVINIGYTTVLARTPKDCDYRLVASLPDIPKDYVGGLVLPVTSDTCIFALAGVHKHNPPSEIDEVVEFTRKALSSTFLYECIANLEWLGKPTTYRFPSSKWNEYHKNSDFPEGLVALADCVCSFNPFYGQGMTSAAIGAYSLYHQLSKKHEKARTKQEFYESVVSEKGTFSKDFNNFYAAYLNDPWSMATSGDLRYPETTGAERGYLAGFAGAFSEVLLRLAREDYSVRETFVLVSNSCIPPSELVMPSILWKVLKFKLRELWHQKKKAQ